MTIVTILTIINIVNGLLTLAKDAPSVIEEAKSLLGKVRPYAHDAGVDCATEFAAAEQRLAQSTGA